MLYAKELQFKIFSSVEGFFDFKFNANLFLFVLFCFSDLRNVKFDHLAVKKNTSSITPSHHITSITIQYSITQKKKIVLMVTIGGSLFLGKGNAWCSDITFVLVKSNRKRFLGHQAVMSY